MVRFGALLVLLAAATGGTPVVPVLPSATGGTPVVPVLPSPRAVFEQPPQSAKTGVWWHWMGCNVTREGIVKDLDWFKAMGVGAATVFGMADVCSPWATKIDNSPHAGLIAFTPEWWKLVRFACEEAEKRGIELGLHNCPGYTCTGGPWIPPRLAMRELVFNVTNATEQISLTAHADYPVENGDTGAFEKPQIAARRTDLQEIAVVNGVRVQHIPMGAFTQPNQWENFGLECDKMNPEAVAFHLDHVIGDMKKYVGDQIGRGLKFILLDSYEAGTPSWTPRMREEFQARRGYDPLPFLPALGGFPIGGATAGAPSPRSLGADEAVKKFKVDYKRTIQELYRDVLFKMMRERFNAIGLEFACEPYWGPFDSRECAAHVDRLMTEFWYTPKFNRSFPGRLGWEHWRGPNGKRHNVVEAEAFTSGPPHCNWDETPFSIKAAGDTQYARGINRFTLVVAPLQPWNETVRPGMVMGRWGCHFGRNQTWAYSGKGLFDYFNRCQALLQWGEPGKGNISGNHILPAGTLITAHSRVDGRDKDLLDRKGAKYVIWVVNHSDHWASIEMGLPTTDKQPEWYDPVTGQITPLAFKGKLVPIQLAPAGSGFLVLEKPLDAAVSNSAGWSSSDRCDRQPDRKYWQQMRKPFDGPGRGADEFAFVGPWSLTFPAKGLPVAKLRGDGALAVASPDLCIELAELVDWTQHSDPRVKYYSGTVTYRRKFRFTSQRAPELLTLGNCNRQIAGVKINGRDLGTCWCEPYEVRLPAGVVREGENLLEIEFTNVWANRLIGDEQEPADCEFAKPPFPGGWYLKRFPDWFRDAVRAGSADPLANRPSKGRVGFCDWNYFDAKSKLTSSGLLGPVRLH